MTKTLGSDHEQDPADFSGQSAYAFEQVYNAYLPRVFAYVCYRVGNIHDSEDLVSKVFLKVAEALRSGRFESRHDNSLPAWLFRIAHNTVTDYYRRNRAESAPVPLGEVPALNASALLPDDIVLRKEQFARLRQLLLTLSPRRQEIVTLRFFGGLRNAQIAEVLGLDERTVASHLCRGLEELHRLYLQEQALDVEN